MKKKALLTVIICFFNEGDEVENTLLSLQETAAGEPIQILLINDASTDGYDYRSVAGKFGAQYIVHDQQAGPAPCRCEGVEKCTTPYFLFLDAHMRFYTPKWDTCLIRLLEQNPRAILCSQTRRLCRDEEGVVVLDDNTHQSYGAYIDFANKEMFRVTWNYYDWHPYGELLEIPCILGAAYAMHKTYWDRIKGLDGLFLYGSDEELLSIKAWCEGGKCLLTKNLVVGHLYRTEFPYEVFSKRIVYNKLFTAELLLPYSEKRAIFRKMELVTPEPFKEAFELLKQNYPLIKKQRSDFRSLFTQPVSTFLELNERFKSRALHQNVKDSANKTT